MEINSLLNEYIIVLYDGNCDFCNSSILFFLDKKPSKNIRFISQQSPYGVKIKTIFNIEKVNIDTIILVKNNVIHKKSEAFLKIFQYLKFPWNILSFLQYIPLFVSDKIYDIIAKNRYILSNEKCRILTKEQKEYFL